jgi:hypothetical protein
MPWTTTINDGTLEVRFPEGMRAPEWTHLLDDILQELPVARRVRFVLPGRVEGRGSVQPLDDLIRKLTARGVDVERREVGPPRPTDLRLDPPRDGNVP